MLVWTRVTLNPYGLNKIEHSSRPLTARTPYEVVSTSSHTPKKGA